MLIEKPYHPSVLSGRVQLRRSLWKYTCGLMLVKIFNNPPFNYQIYGMGVVFEFSTFRGKTSPPLNSFITSSSSILLLLRL
jgi:hypothetical protein